MNRALSASDQAETTSAGEDPVVEECLRDALGPYLDLLSPSELAEHRRLLTAFIKTHPAAMPLYERLRRRPAGNIRSGEVAREGTLAGEGFADAGTGTSGATG
jgi:hypothetical protein